MNIKEEINIMLLGLDCGLLDSTDILNWIENCLKDDKDIPDVIYDIPFVKSHKIADIKSILFEACNWKVSVNSIHCISGLTYIKLENNNIDIDKSLTIVYNLLLKNNLYDINEQMQNKIMYFSDGYCLATSSIYGNVESISNEFKLWLRSYELYSLKFRNLI
ncbi:hypothetical protein AN1V17_16290 [Vallitalea sediminicola]